MTESQTQPHGTDTRELHQRLHVDGVRRPGRVNVDGGLYREPRPRRDWSVSGWRQLGDALRALAWLAVFLLAAIIAAAAAVAAIHAARLP